jgi:cyclic pyranopterin phosphate synthase
MPDKKLSHYDETGRAKMVDISKKEITSRMAVATGKIFMSQGTLAKIQEKRTAKGDPFETARLAGIMAAKKTPELIPMCHPILLSGINVDFIVQPSDGKKIATIEVRAVVSASGQTGVEMEAMTAVAVAALTLYDMCKAVDKGISFGEIGLAFKSGGKSGSYTRATK